MWVLLMYISGSTIIHQGSYFFWVGWFLVTLTFARYLSPIFFSIIGVANILTANFAYIFSESLEFAEGIFYFGYSLLVVALIWSAWRISADRFMRVFA